MVIDTNPKIVLYDSIESLPYKRYREYNKYLLLQAVGNDLPSRVNEIRLANKMEDNKAVENACMNLLTSYQIAINTSIDPTLKTFACLVKKIGNESTDDLSETYDDILNIKGLTYEKVVEALSEVKKN